MKKIKFFSLIFYLLITTSGNVLSSDELKNKIYKNLRCIVCQGQSIADSNSEFALTVKSVVNDKLESGLSENEIYEFMSEKYGDWILYNPPLKPKTFLLWLFPYAFFIMAGIALFYLFKKTIKHRKY